VRRLRGLPVGESSEAAYQPTKLEVVPIPTGLQGAAQVGH